MSIGNRTCPFNQGNCYRQIDSPPKMSTSQFLVSVNMLPCMAKGNKGCRWNFCCSSADSKLGRLSWVIQVPRCNHRVLLRILKSRRGRQEVRVMQSERNLTSSPCSPIADFEDGGRGLQAKDCRWPLEARKGKKWILPLDPPERNMALPTP